MKNSSLPTIYKYSQNLFHVLQLKLGKDVSPQLDQAFSDAINQGGLEELDFKRPEGQSYNPRPARIALILINESQQIEEALLLAAFQASILSSEIVGNKIVTEALDICKGHDKNQPSRNAKLLALALHLDRSRHFHLSPNYSDKIIRAEFHVLTKKVLDLAGSECQRLNVLLTHWLSRDEKKLNQ